MSRNPVVQASTGAECREEAGGGVEKDPFGKAAPVQVGAVSAKCLRCGATGFLRAKRKTQEKADTRLCAGCGAEYVFGELLNQISGEVMRQAQDALDAAEALRKKLSKS
jgi:hypothetical protein